MSRVVLVYSGGLDSTVGLYHLADRGFDVVYALSVNYGQRHAVELMYSRWHCTRLKLQRVELDLSGIASQVLTGSSQSDPTVDVPEGHYEDPKMVATVVPNRNMLLLTLAGAFAASKGIDKIVYCPHVGDRAVYPDCRPEFIEAARRVLNVCHLYPIKLLTPFMDMAKSDIVALGHRLNVPFDMTYSCYRGQQIHCGRCSTCIERLEAFHLAGVPDPTRYEDPDFWKTIVKGR